MPVIFVTVEEALGDLAQLKRGERVLIHAAAGGVGLVAIQCPGRQATDIYIYTYTLLYWSELSSLPCDEVRSLRWCRGLCHCRGR